jgi:phosphopantothenoylcysteine decarboxylase/phosphopantothenate--cysteine ligase
MSLKNKNIVLGVTGGIAAYKAAELTRQLIKKGAKVRVVMTRAAQAFITPLTLQALSGEAVRSELFDPAHEAAMGHIELARWADLILIAPATANLLAKLAQGRADDLLSTLCLATKAPIAVAPAMNQQMWQSAATINNLQQLQARSHIILGPACGDQACGETGPGRMLEPGEILAGIKRLFAPGALDGKQVLITAGATREPIDPVRYLSNRSSGKMGFAMAAAAVQAGAKVTLIAGPVSLGVSDAVNRINVETATEMHTQVMENIDSCNIFIATAAVSDYRPETIETQKIKKSAEQLTLLLRRNPDILADVAKRSAKPFCVGFAAETQNLERYARQKLINKNLDMIAANPVNNGLGFDQDKNTLHIFWREGDIKLATAPKTELAHQLIALIAKHLQRRQDASNRH